MNKLLEIGLIILGVSSVGIADVLIKKIFSPRTGFFTDVKNPLMIAVISLYIIQIIVFSFIFDHKAELGIVGIIQTALYAVIVIGSGILFFNEQISLLQWIGIGLAIVGVVLMNV
jgi:drug/metabolite transporter (DMT)-like permease